MAKRKAKKPQEDTSILLESSVSQTRRRINSYTSPALLFIIIFAVLASVMGWFCIQQQQSLDQLSESFTAMQKRVTNLQQVVDMTDIQTDDAGLSVEERIIALEEAQKQAQEKAEVALATSEKMKNSDHYSEFWALRDEMDTRLTEIKQVALSVTTLQAMFKNQSEEFEAVKESVVAGLSSSSALAETVGGLTNAVAGTCSRVDEQVALVEALDAQLEGQASDLKELKESVHLHNVALLANNQEMAAIKELVENNHVMHAQALEEMLSSVQTTLDEQFFTSQTLRSSVMAQLQTLHTQLANAPSMKLKSNEEGPAAEEVISTTTQNATEVQEKLEDAEEKDEQQDAEDEAEEEEAEEEEQPLEQEAEGSVIEEQEEEEITEEEEKTSPEEQEDEEITEESEEQEKLEDVEEKDEQQDAEEEEDEEEAQQEEQPPEQEAEGSVIEEQEEEEETTPEEQDDEEITEESEEQEKLEDVEEKDEQQDAEEEEEEEEAQQEEQPLEQEAEGSAIEERLQKRKKRLHQKSKKTRK